MAWVATVIGGIGLAGSLAETGYALSGANQPQYPNEAASSAQMAGTEANLLPIQRGMAAAAQSGGSYTFNLPQGVSAGSLGIQTTGQGWYDARGQLVSPQQNYMVVASPFGGIRLRQGYGGQGATGNEATGPRRSGNSALPYAMPQSQGLTWRPGTTTINGVPIKQNSDGSYTIDFKGFGTAQAAATEAQQNAASQLALEQQYDPKFIAQALQQEQQADPESFAARNEMNNLVQDQGRAAGGVSDTGDRATGNPAYQDGNLNEPVSSMLNSQILDTLNAAQNNSLTAVDTQRLNAAVADALGSRGGGGATGNPSLTVGAQLTSGFPGEQRAAGAAATAMGFLASGSDPEDIQYRRTQQNLANLSAEANGQTPSSQFASLSGASSGPSQLLAAQGQGAALPLLSDNGAAAQQIGLQNWQTQMENANNQINPWMVGLNGLLAVGTAATMPAATMPTPRSAIGMQSLLGPQNPVS